MKDPLFNHPSLDTPRSPVPFRRRPLSLSVSVLTAALLAACGGGGGGGGVGNGSSASGLDDATATAYAANATMINSDASTASDVAVLATQAAVQGTAGIDSGNRAAAQSVGHTSGTSADTSAGRSAGTSATADAFTAPRYNCAGGGTADVAISNGTNGSESNGQLDAGEVYTVAFSACKTSATAAPVTGGLVMTVNSASGDAANGTLGVGLVATGLTATLPRGTISLTGSSTRTATVVTDADGTVHLSGEYATPSLVLATQFNNRASTFTLTATDIQRTATIVGGVVVAGSVNGTHTLSASLPRGDFSFTVATIGSATYAADGTPASGGWTITLPDSLVGVTVANAIATITIDKGKDGTIDRTITVPASTLKTDAG